jgi:ubiquinone/menaquinone biosynthesis C-methylase UbiE
VNRGEYEVMFETEDTHWWYRALRGILGDALQIHGEVQQPRVLDLGCGTGANMVMVGASAEVYGVDFAAEALLCCKKRGLSRVAAASAPVLPFADSVFDIVYSCDVLSHRSITSKADVIVEIGRVLRPGGLLILNLPAYQWLHSSHDVAVQMDKRFGRGETVAMLRGSGFDILRATYWNTLLFPIVCAVRIWRKVKAPEGSDLAAGSGGSLSPLFTGLLGLERRILRYAALPYGLSVFIVARRPSSGG